VEDELGLHWSEPRFYQVHCRRSPGVAKRKLVSSGIKTVTPTFLRARLTASPAKSPELLHQPHLSAGFTKSRQTSRIKPQGGVNPKQDKRATIRRKPRSRMRMLEDYDTFAVHRFPEARSCESTSPSLLGQRIDPILAWSRRWNRRIAGEARLRQISVSACGDGDVLAPIDLVDCGNPFGCSGKIDLPQNLAAVPVIRSEFSI